MRIPTTITLLILALLATAPALAQYEDDEKLKDEFTAAVAASGAA